MKNILITGASQGIGRATAIEAAKNKAFVGINYSKNSDAAESCLEAVKSHGGDGIILKCDVADNVAVKDMFKKGEKTLLLTVVNSNNQRNYLGVKIN